MFFSNGRQQYQCEYHFAFIRRGIGLVVAADKATTAMIELEKNSKMILFEDVNKITVADDVAVISIMEQI
jgi:hypothetical protein